MKCIAPITNLSQTRVTVRFGYRNAVPNANTHSMIKIGRKARVDNLKAECCIEETTSSYTTLLQLTVDYQRNQGQERGSTPHGAIDYHNLSSSRSRLYRTYMFGRAPLPLEVHDSSFQAPP